MHGEEIERVLEGKGRREGLGACRRDEGVEWHELWGVERRREEVAVWVREGGGGREGVCR